MRKPSKNFAFVALTKIGAFALMVLGAAANPADSCCGGGAGSGGSGGSGGGDGGAGGGGGATCFDYASFEDMTPTVMFKADVLPILRQSCSASTACHGDESPPKGQPYLGPDAMAGSASTMQIAKIFEQNVDVFSSKATTMKIVDRFSPQTSFLMHKIDGTLTCADVKCDVDCGVAMPKDAAILPQAQRDIVRRWIAQGAINN
ncbi:MAG: hypothetical protein IPM54_07260 [Polyangiaceae bacterium]|nr:hypothetical protein [Polyangiaceae bacterium]